MSPECIQLVNSTKELVQQLINHPLYSTLKSKQSLQKFMEHHVFAVWDFMSLVKSLQAELTCIQVPWLPKGNPAIRALINEIILGEESDIDQNGKACSHFELYLDAMREADCNVENINSFIQDIQSGISVEQALQSGRIPRAASDFVHHTFSVIKTGKPHIIAAVFTFGREDLIPDMFLPLIEELKKEYPSQFDTLQYYVQRHIDIDGGHHSHLALQMVQELCGNDAEKWKEAEYAVKAALQSRIALWDAIAY